MPGRVAQLVARLTREPEVPGSIPGPATYFCFSFRSCQLLAKVLYVHEVLVNRLGGLSLPRKSVVRLTDRRDMSIDVHHGRKTTVQQQQQLGPPVSVRSGKMYYHGDQIGKHPMIP